MIPGSLQGQTRKAPFFEGWYFKLVDTSGGAWAVIPGFFRSRDERESHAFVQVYDARGRRRTYARYPLEALRFGEALQIGPNRFEERELLLDLDAEGRRIRGRLSLGAPAPWPSSLRYPGFMG